MFLFGASIFVRRWTLTPRRSATTSGGTTWTRRSFGPWSWAPPFPSCARCWKQAAWLDMFVAFCGQIYPSSSVRAPIFLWLLYWCFVHRWLKISKDEGFGGLLYLKAHKKNWPTGRHSNCHANFSRFWSWHIFNATNFPPGLLRESQHGGLAVLLQHEKVGEPEFLRKILGCNFHQPLNHMVFWLRRINLFDK